MESAEKARTPICKRIRSTGIDSKDSILLAYVAWQAGKSNGLSYQPARLHRLAKSIPGILKHLQIQALQGLDKHNKIWFGLGYKENALVLIMMKFAFRSTTPLLRKRFNIFFRGSSFSISLTEFWTPLPTGSYLFGT